MPRTLLSTLLVLALAAPARPEEAPTFERTVRPILKANCFRCHGEEPKLRGGLDLRLRRLIVAGGESGPAIVPGDSNASLLVRRIASGEMPPGEDAPKLGAGEIDAIRAWVDGGAVTAAPEPVEVGRGLLITGAERAFWSFRPVRRPAIPEVATRARKRSAIDAFVLRRLEDAGPSLLADADRVTLIRRATLDLLGLPPTPDEVAEFLADTSPDAYERLLDRLFASPRYGERQGRHWLDIAGYADSEGATDADAERKWAYRYRDWVISSFDRDLPIDEFIREQLAGDEMVPRPWTSLAPDDIDRLAATGFLRLAPDGTGSGANNAVARNRVIADTMTIVSTALLGLTVQCAQCHHHRYDPIPQEDYYRLRSIFEPALDWKSWRTPAQRLVSLYTDADREAAAGVEVEAKKIDAERAAKQAEFIERTFERELKKLDESLREPIRLARKTAPNARSVEQKRLLKESPSVNVTAGSLYLYDSKAANELKKLAAKAAEVRSRKPVKEFVRALTEMPGKAPATHVFHRGDHEQPGDEVAPAGLSVLARPDGRNTGIPLDDPTLPTTGRRLEYARRLTDGMHPLVARVAVNRVWLHHFGRGIVATPGDFGALGDRPTHPELLDWLASELVEIGWSRKRLQRAIMTSTAYRQRGWRSVESDGSEGVAGDENLYTGKPLRRLEAEAIRDSMLAVSGRLDLKRFGPPVPVMHDRVGQVVVGKENLNAGRPGAVIPMHGEDLRRSVWVQVRRSRPLGVLDAFDAPLMEPNCEKRSSSTVAPQALLLMNGPFALEQAEHFAKRVRKEAGNAPQARVERAWRLAYGRAPETTEMNDALGFLDAQAKQFRRVDDGSGAAKGKPADPELRALSSLCHVILGSSEFLYVD